MPSPDFDLVIIGAGSGGLTAARFAAQLGAKVALIEKNRIGGDCTWTGCVPSKALLKVAKVAHEIRTAGRLGINACEPVVDMKCVREYVQNAVSQVYRFETPEVLREEGIEVIGGAARFLDANTIGVRDRAISAKAFLLTTGAHPRTPDIAGLSDVPWLTYERIFELDRLPSEAVIAGGGPIATEIAQAWQRLGSRVTIVAERIFPKDEPEVREVMKRVFEREGVRFVWGRARWARRDGDAIVVGTDDAEARGDLLLIAAGRRPTVAGLDLEKAGVRFSENGIPVDRRLRTNVKHIFAAGDVAGEYQFTHLAGWQAFHAARNALLPGSSSGEAPLLPWVTFTDPEVAHAGLTEAQARAKFGENVVVRRQDLSHCDRAVCEGDFDGFTKLIAWKNGPVVGATIVHARAGEAIAELAVAIRHKLTFADLAGTLHAYPSYSAAVQQIAAEMAVEQSLAGASGALMRGLSKIVR